ncbi:MAG TPA: nucleoside kinase [Mollicutes bacterium]|nr:nucleoside kinase [Mollicutes bacterium]
MTKTLFFDKINLKNRGCVMSTVNIKYKDKVYTYPKGKTLLEISKNFKDEYEYDIIIASVNNKLTELNQKLEKDCNIKFFDITHALGNKVYERGLTYLYIKAIFDVLKCDVLIEHSIDKGIYTRLAKDIDLSIEDVELVKRRMQELVNANIPFQKISVSRIDAIDYFEKNNQLDKVEGLKYVSNTFINLYRFDNMYDYFYGEMPIDSSYLKWFDLKKVTPNGIVLIIPNIYSDSKIKPYVHHEKMFEEFSEYHAWCDRVNVNNISDLNNMIASDDISDLIYMSEMDQNARLFDIAKTISDDPNIKVVLIAGPSSSGKTTTSRKLSLYLRSIGLNPFAISIDDYFLDRDKTPLKEDGNPDFEALSAINVDLFNEHLGRLLNYEEVSMPIYNFITGKSEPNSKRMKLREKDILIIEGLHALNNELTKTIDASKKYKMYLSPLTSINIDNHNRISTSDNRIIRRMVRDHKYRGYSAAYTLAKWKDVRSGEERFVFPYQDEADVVFNTSLVYEMGVLRLYAEPLLFSISDDDPYYGEAVRLLNILRNALPLTSDLVPLDSIIREFIGDSYFE